MDKPRHPQVIRPWTIQRTQKNKWSAPPEREQQRERDKKHNSLGVADGSRRVGRGFDNGRAGIYHFSYSPIQQRLLVGGVMPSTKSKRPALQVTWIRDDKTDGEARYRVQVFGKDARTFDVRISLKAKYQAKPSPEEKIEEWFKCNPLAESGVSMKLPDEHFCARDN